MSAATGVSAHTLRYYERAELIRPVARNAGNQRRYSAADVEWVTLLLRLRYGISGRPNPHRHSYRHGDESLPHLRFVPPRKLKPRSGYPD